MMEINQREIKWRMILANFVSLIAVITRAHSHYVRIYAPTESESNLHRVAFL